jgi:hypothetical protein
MMDVWTDEGKPHETQVPCACGCGVPTTLGPNAGPPFAMTAPCYQRHRDMLHRVTMRLWSEAREVWSRFIAAKREHTSRDGTVDRGALERAVASLMGESATQVMLGGPFAEWITGPDGFLVHCGLRSQRVDE